MDTLVHKVEQPFHFFIPSVSLVPVSRPQVVNAEERASKSATLQQPIDTVGAGLIGGTSSRHGHTNTQQTHQ